MRRFGWGVLAGMLVAGAAPVAASTIIREYEETYYHYEYLPHSNGLTKVFSQENPEDVRDTASWYLAPIRIVIGLPGVYERQLANRTVSFFDLLEDGAGGHVTGWLDLSFVDPLSISGPGVGAWGFGEAYDVNEDDGWGTDPISNGSVTFGSEMNIIAWDIITGIWDNCGTSRGVSSSELTIGQEWCNDYSPGSNEWDFPVENGLLLSFFNPEGTGTWSLIEESAYRHVEYDDDYHSYFIPKGTSGVIPNPDDLGGGGGPPGPVPLSPIPLPASVLLLLSGLGALGAGGLWRRRRAAA